MPLITKIHKEPIGDFTIKFSLRSNLFEIEYPTEDMDIHNKLTNQVIVRNYNLAKWEDVEAELQSILDQYRAKILFTRKVIIIQLRTSVSDYTFEEKQDWFGKVSIHDKKFDHLDDVEGFALKWYVANEYQYPKGHLRYRIIETNNNNGHKKYYAENDTTNILPQLLHDDYGGKLRLYDYTDNLYQFLKEIEDSIATMLHRMNEYFSLDPQKFLTNVESQVKLLPNAREDTDPRT